MMFFPAIMTLFYVIFRFFLKTEKVFPAFFRKPQTSLLVISKTFAKTNGKN